MSDVDPDFDEFGELFGTPMPQGLADTLLRALVTSSKTFRVIYEEHVRNGFSDAQALDITLALQRDLMHAAAIVGGVVGKEIAKRGAEEDGG